MSVHALDCVPDDRGARVPEGESLLEPLLIAGVPMAHACGGRARCSTCRLRVEEGMEHFAPREAAESELAQRLGLTPDIRLACQAKLRGPARVRRLVLDREDEALVSALGLEGKQESVGEEVELAALFCDIAGFTSLSERLPAYDVVHLLNRWYARAGEVVERSGGQINTYIGDGFLALFEPPQERGPAWGAARAALDLVSAAAELSAYVESAYCAPFAVRVGAHFGSAVVGPVGVRGQRRRTAIGDTINLASRIEAANKQVGSQVLLSAALHAQLAGRAQIGRRQSLELRGKSEPQELIELLGLREDSEHS